MIRSNAYGDRDATDDVASKADADIAEHDEGVAALGAVVDRIPATSLELAPAPLAILVADREAFA